MSLRASLPRLASPVSTHVVRPRHRHHRPRLAHVDSKNAFSTTACASANSSTPGTIAASPPASSAGGDSSHGSKRATAPPSTAAPAPGPVASTSNTAPASVQQQQAPQQRLRPRDRLQWIEDKNGSVLGTSSTSTSGKGKGKERQLDPALSSLSEGQPASGVTPDPETYAEYASSSSRHPFDDSTSPSVFAASPFSSSAASSSSSSSSVHGSGGGELIIPPPVPGLPPLHTHRLPVRPVPFSTRKFVKDLELNGGVKREMAEVIMHATRGLLTSREAKAKEAVLNRQDLENEAYLFQAALAELKTGSQVKLRNDSITLRSLTANLQRETDGLEQKMKEDMQRLASDIQLEMNTRKEETATELQSLDKRVMDLNSKFTILLSEVRTEIEATKWVSTRRVMTAITITVVVLVAYFSVNKSRGGGGKNGAHSSSSSDKKKNRARGGAPSDSADDSSSSLSSSDGVPSIEELGVTPTENEAEVVYGLQHHHPLGGVSNFGAPVTGLSSGSSSGQSGGGGAGAAAAPPKSSSSSSSSSWASFWPGASSLTGSSDSTITSSRRTGGGSEGGSAEDGYVQA